jgi:phosphoadenosine phosphosulfate reductase
MDKKCLNAWLGNSSPLSVIQWAIDVFSPKLVVTSSFGLNGVALIHMLQKITRKVPIIFVNTGYMFEETLKTKRRIEAAYGVNVLTFRPSLSVKEQIQKFGSALFIRRPDICCALRKIEPMQRALAELKPKAILNGRARFQTHTRQNLPIVEWEKSSIQINPLAGWSHKQIDAYVKEHNIPYNSLYDIGYPSVGCRPCTRPVLEDEHIRAGRWAELDRIECGLWTKNII